VYDTGETFYGNEMQLFIEQPGGPPKSSYFNFTYQAYRENGQVLGISVFAYEVGEQVLARQQREQNQRRLQLITDALPVLIGYIDREEKYQFVNRGYEIWFKRNAEEMLDRPVQEVLGDDAYREVKPYVDRALAGERLDFETHMFYRDDFIRYIRTNYVPDVQDGKVVGFYSMVADTTAQVVGRQQVQDLNEELAAINEELQATNEELLDTNQQLTRTNVDLDNFIYTASHDLRAPIANIEGLLYALMQHLPEIGTDHQVLPILEMMQGAVERFQKTIDHLTDVTKLQKEHIQPSQTVDLAAIAQEVRLDLAPLLESTQAQLDVDVHQCPTISFSQKNLRSVVYNLLSNALKYRSPHRVPHVQLRCYQMEGFSVLEVQDNGLGLNEAQQVRLFGMFQRLHDHVEGTGIGLYMVKRMVENVGGHIRVQSTLGVGTTFSVFFPR
jgi:PAS domain S-box-containing protein